MRQRTYTGTITRHSESNYSFGTFYTELKPDPKTGYEHVHEGFDQHGSDFGSLAEAHSAMLRARPGLEFTSASEDGKYRHYSVPDPLAFDWLALPEEKRNAIIAEMIKDFSIHKEK